MKRTTGIGTVWFLRDAERTMNKISDDLNRASTDEERERLRPMLTMAIARCNELVRQFNETGTCR